MRVLVIHHESEYFAGAEKMLGYFLAGLNKAGLEVLAATTLESRVREIIPADMPTCWVPNNARFSISGLWSQVQALRRQYRRQPFDIIHGWAARDWELTALISRLTRTPALGTLHDHPNARFLSPARRRLMRGAAAFGLRRVVCVSEAVRQACGEAGYAATRLAVVRNGVPLRARTPSARPAGRWRLGFLGLFSERKGLRGLFHIIDDFARSSPAEWELEIAGDAQDDAGRALVTQLQNEFATRPWWTQVRWRGWVKEPAEFLAGIDVLICPSTDFDPFPNVLLEAAQSGVPVLAAQVGGVPEIVADGKTGWVFETQAWHAAATKLATVLNTPDEVQAIGKAARKRIEDDFTVERMVADYLSIYCTLATK
jgi:glycosyltransferase involved in cell wall biosynthesis